MDKYSFWRDPAVRLSFCEKYFPWETESEVNRWLLEPTGISLAELMKRPEGLRYKSIPYEKFFTRPFLTPSGKFEFSSKYLRDLGFSGIPEYGEPYHVRFKTSDFPLTLISGALEIRAKVVDEEEILRGVLQITHGWDEANVNLITNDSIIDPVSGFPLLKSVPVKIEKVK